MAEPFLSEIRLFSFNFPPKGWAFCNGQLLPINQNQALFALLGTTYGGNGQTTFALPDLRGRVPVHSGNGVLLGERGGAEAHTLSISELAAHSHGVSASSEIADRRETVSNGGLTTPNYWAVTATSTYHKSRGSSVGLHPDIITATGGSQPHNNMQPYLTLNYCISLQGIFPSQN